MFATLLSQAVYCMCRFNTFAAFTLPVIGLPASDAGSSGVARRSSVLASGPVTV
jgi:hypothetical protein